LHFYFSSNNNFLLFFLFFLSFGMAAGFFPLPTRLSYTIAATPWPSASLMSSALIKLGIYGILRILVYVESDLLEIGIFIYVLSAISGLYGILQATVQKDFKKMLAYSSIENIGIIGMGIGMGILGIALKSQLITFMGFAGALMHVINHSLIKALLFYTAGSVFLRTGTRQMNRLGGLIKKMPVTSILFLVGSLAIGGLPPFNGFVSKFLIYSGMMGLLHANFSMDPLELASLVSLVLMGGISVFTFTRAFGLMFLGTPKSLKATKASEVNFFMLFPSILTVLVMLSISFAPDIFVKFISIAVNLYMPVESTGIVIPQFDSIGQLGLVSILFIILMVTIYVIRTLIVKSNTESYESTKSSGYIRSRDKLKYAGPSFSGNLAPLIKPIVYIKTGFKENGISLKDRTYKKENDRSIKTKGNAETVKKESLFLSLLAKVQKGQASHYISSAFLFIALVLLLLIVLNIIK
jgi:hydrogenase-4 component B